MNPSGDEQKPGDVISPQSSQANSTDEVSFQVPREPAQQLPQPVPETAPSEQSLPTPEPAEPVAPTPEATVEPTPQPAQAQPTAPQEQAPALVEAPQQYTSAPQVAPVGPAAPSGDHVSWTASEFIHHAKSLNWYLVLGIGGLLGAIIVYFLTKDVVSTVVILVVAILFGVYAATSKPRVLPYEISAHGIQIGPKQYMYADYKTFSLVHESSAFSKIELMPLKRFAPSVSMYFPPEEEEMIVNTLSQYLPYEERKQDATDRLLNKIRF